MQACASKTEALVPGEEGDTLTAGRKRVQQSSFSSCSWKMLHCRCPQQVQNQASPCVQGPQCPLLAIGWNLLKHKLATFADKVSVTTKSRRWHAKCCFACFRASTQSVTELFKCECVVLESHAVGKNQIRRVPACMRSLTRQAHWPSSGPPDRPFRPISEQ